MSAFGYKVVGSLQPEGIRLTIRKVDIVVKDKVVVFDGCNHIKKAKLLIPETTTYENYYSVLSAYTFCLADEVELAKTTVTNHILYNMRKIHEESIKYSVAIDHMLKGEPLPIVVLREIDNTEDFYRNQL